MESLPDLAAKPTAYSGCCLALSRTLLDFIAALLSPQPALVLSIGSGFGLLEAYLASKTYNVRVIGIEVAPSSNLYLPEGNHRIVHGSRSLEPLAADAKTWLFVYPRRVGLVQEYLAEYGSQNVETVIWAGPCADWDDFKDCVTAKWDVVVHSAAEIGGRAWELIAVMSKRYT